MKNQNRTMATKTLAYCALLTALSVVLARLLGLMPEQSVRLSIEAVPIFLAGMLFGPLAGGLVGFSADFVGCLFSAYGYNPIFCIPPILYGVFGGIFRHYLSRKVSPLRLGVAFLPPVALGSVLYQSCTLSYMYFDGSFFEGLLFYLSTRSVQFAITLVVDVAVIFLLFKAEIFERVGLWPPRKKKKGSCDHDS